MTERIRKGSREYHFQRHSDRRPHPDGRRLGPREAASVIRSLHSRDAQALLRRLAVAGPLEDRSHDVGDRIVGMVERGQLEVWVVDTKRTIGERREAPEREAPPPIAPPDTHTVVIELVDAENNPVPFEPYRIKLPDGRVQTRTLDKHGRDRITGIRTPGQCMVCFHRRDAAVWARA
jgi:hypothetical protein